MNKKAFPGGVIVSSEMDLSNIGRKTNFDKVDSYKWRDEETRIEKERIEEKKEKRKQSHRKGCHGCGFSSSWFPLFLFMD